MKVIEIVLCVVSVAAAVVACVHAFYCIWRDRCHRRAKTVPSSTVERTLTNIAAVHEAGHALAAALCTKVVRLEVVTADLTGQPRVEYQIQSDADWCNAVIGMAGIAAEIDVFGRFSGSLASDDLNRARKHAERLAMSAYYRASHTSSSPAPKFAQIFLHPPDPYVIEILADAYREAKFLVSKRRGEHAKLTGALLHFGSLRGREIDRYVGGDRFFIRMLAITGRDFL